MNYINHFGENSQDYLQYRPVYPQELYDFLVSLVKQRELAWDCATGNGQSAVPLSDFFKEVIATDINQSQLKVALKRKNIHYEVCSAEKTQINNSSVNLITIAQALHWFNLNEFYREVKRVSTPDGIIAAWSYSLGSINRELDQPIKKLYWEILGEKYWPKERKWIEDKYETIPFPFLKINSPHFTIEKHLTFSELIGYLNTWSAVKEYQKENLTNPIDLVYPSLVDAWGENAILIMHWPIHLLVGRVFS